MVSTHSLRGLRVGSGGTICCGLTLLLAGCAGCWLMFQSSRELDVSTRNVGLRGTVYAMATKAAGATATAAAGAGPLHLILFGPPAAGKGTQADNIVSRFGVLHISTGDILRAAVRAKTAVGVKAKAFMDRGLLVPDGVVIELVAQAMASSRAAKRGWMLDGFPRTGEQAAHLLASPGSLPSVVLVYS